MSEPRLDVRKTYKLLINGAFPRSESGRSYKVFTQSGEFLANVAQGSRKDLRDAVLAARGVQAKWWASSAYNRGQVIYRLAEMAESRRDELAVHVGAAEGLRAPEAFASVARAIDRIVWYAGWTDKITQVYGGANPVAGPFFNFSLPTPSGVVAVLASQESSLEGFVDAVLAPIAAGNTVVLKPAEITPLTTLRVAELMTEVGFPPGVVNIVPGYGHTAGQRLAEHPGVKKIAFTGSTATGRKIVQASAGNLKRVQLELGGKGANIVFSDAFLPAAINGSAFAIFHNQGQACIAGSRLLLQQDIADQFLEGFLKLAGSIRLGDPLDPRTEMGPLTSQRQQQSVLTYCDVARQQGAQLLLGGRKPAAADLAGGYFVEPTVVKAQPQDRVCQEEVFGPFVAVTTFRDEAEAVAIANSTEYGLGGGLWTSNLQRAHRIAGSMRSGMVWINCYKRVNPGSPFGGVGSSGYGREMGFEAMHDYTDAKSVWVNVDAQIPPHYPR